MRRDLAGFSAVLVLVLAAVTLNASQPEEPLNASELSHPTLEQCERVGNRYDRQFCISSVAELENNPEICEEIQGYPNIRRFCEARVNLNSSKCRTLNDKSLIKSCLNSIEMKKNWSGPG